MRSCCFDYSHSIGVLGNTSESYLIVLVDITFGCYLLSLPTSMLTHARIDDSRLRSRAYTIAALQLRCLLPCWLKRSFPTEVLRQTIGLEKLLCY